MIQVVSIFNFDTTKKSLEEWEEYYTGPGPVYHRQDHEDGSRRYYLLPGSNAILRGYGRLPERIVVAGRPRSRSHDAGDGPGLEALHYRGSGRGGVTETSCQAGLFP